MIQTFPFILWQSIYLKVRVIKLQEGFKGENRMDHYKNLFKPGFANSFFSCFRREEKRGKEEPVVVHLVNQ